MHARNQPKNGLEKTFLHFLPYLMIFQCSEVPSNTLNNHHTWQTFDKKWRKPLYNLPSIHFSTWYPKTAIPFPPLSFITNFLKIFENCFKLRLTHTKKNINSVNRKLNRILVNRVYHYDHYNIYTYITQIQVSLQICLRRIFPIIFFQKCLIKYTFLGVIFFSILTQGAVGHICAISIYFSNVSQTPAT